MHMAAVKRILGMLRGLVLGSPNLHNKDPIPGALTLWLEITKTLHFGPKLKAESSRRCSGYATLKSLPGLLEFRVEICDIICEVLAS